MGTKRERLIKISQFGQWARIKRLQNLEDTNEIVELLNTSKQFLYMVENGYKQPPEKWLPILIEHYNLNEAEAEELTDIFLMTRHQISIKVNSKTPLYLRRLFATMERKIYYIDDETAQEIIKILENREDEINKRKWQNEKTNCD